MRNFMQKNVKKVVVAGAAIYGSVLAAAPVALPATAEADVTGSIGVGGGLLITAAVAVVGFVVVGRLLKKI